MNTQEETRQRNVTYLYGLVHSIILLDETVSEEINLDCNAYYIDIADAYQIQVTHNKYWDETTTETFDIDPDNPKKVLFEIYNYIESLHKVKFSYETKASDDEMTKGCDMYHASKEDF